MRKMNKLMVVALIVMGSGLWAEKLNLSLGANYDFEQWIASDYNKKSQYDIQTLALDASMRYQLKKGYVRGKVSYFMLPLMMSYQDALAVDEKNYGEEFWKLGTDIRAGYGHRLYKKGKLSLYGGGYLSFRVMYFLKPYMVGENAMLEPFSFNSAGVGLFAEGFYNITKDLFLGINIEGGYNYLPFGNRPQVPDHGYGYNTGIFMGIRL